MTKEELSAINNIWQAEYDTGGVVSVEGNKVYVYDSDNDLTEAEIDVPDSDLTTVILALNDWLESHRKDEVARLKASINGLNKSTARTRLKLMDMTLKRTES